MRERGEKRAREAHEGRGRGVPSPAPRVLYTLTRALVFFRARLCYSLSLPFRRIITIFDIKKATLSLFLTENGTPSNEGSCGY